ncbi:MAG TPA: CPBP family intramembrane glutamic endopeptidase [Candidatus Saccharimonadales bacterium]|nr:CPBP family intramembrane glutamic endopeptidase [Candidatus Saccharimonadales bacterium]
MSGAKQKDSPAQKRKLKLFKPLRAQPPSDLGGPWFVFGVVVVIFIVSQFIAALILEIILGLAHASSGSLDNSVTAQFFYVLLAEGLSALLAIWAVKKRGLKLPFIGLGRRPKLGDVGRAGVGFLVFYILLIIVSIIASAIFKGYNNGTQDLGFNNLHGPASDVLAFIALVVLPPIGEETLMRGYLFSGLRARLSFVQAGLITSLLFGAAHLLTGAGPGLLWAAGVNTFILSLVLVYLREKTGALYAGMMVHALNNAIAFAVMFHGINL